MKDGLTSITMVVDRSGSMQTVQQEAQKGINAFLGEQKVVPGEAILTLVQFDTEYQVVHSAVPLKDVPEFVLVPRGMTALLDAVGKAINETGERFAQMPEEDRPETVIFVIVTDGHENSSHEFNNEQIRSMVERQQSDWNWHFTFLGADDKAFDEAASIGIAAQHAAVYDPKKSGETYSAVSCAVARTRATGQSLSFTDDERCSMQ